LCIFIFLVWQTNRRGFDGYLGSAVKGKSYFELLKWHSEYFGIIFIFAWQVTRSGAAKRAT